MVCHSSPKEGMWFSCKAQRSSVYRQVKLCCKSGNFLTWAYTVCPKQTLVSMYLLGFEQFSSKLFHVSFLHQSSWTSSHWLNPWKAPSSAGPYCGHWRVQTLLHHFCYSVPQFNPPLIWVLHWLSHSALILGTSEKFSYLSSLRQSNHY